MDNFSIGNASPNNAIPRIVMNAALTNEFLNICHVNVQSLIARNFTKFHELKQTFVDSKIDIICFTETWLNSTISDRMISIDGYKLVRNDRNRQGGGVCMYMRNNLSYKVVSMSSSSSNDFSGTEYLNVEIKVGYDKVLLGVVYNPPNTDCTDVLNDILENSTINYECSFFVGDFNTDLLRSSSRSRRFSEMLDAMSYTCINSQPTFFHQTGCSLLDLLITDAPDVVVKQDQVSMSGVSNHDLVFCSLRLSFNKTDNNVRYRDYVNFDSGALLEGFYSVDWNVFFQMDDPNDMLNFINYHFLMLHDEFIPLRRKKKQRTPWFNNDISYAIINRNLAYGKWKRSKSENDKISYKRLRNIANELIKQAKINYDKQNFNVDLPSKKLWNNI